jgi:AcrR family transcriptional regulator
MSAGQLEVDEHMATPAEVASSAVAFVLSPAERRVAEALLRCVARWGLAKTTIEDLAREAGVSRATVYRLFPGGKQSVLYVAVRAEVQRLVDELLAEAELAADLEQCVVGAMHHAAVFLGEHPALSFLRDHERAVLEQVMSFERMDAVLLSAAATVQPALRRFLPDDAAAEAGVWCARLVVSYLAEPADGVDLCRREDVAQLVRTFVLPGLPAPASARPADHEPA